jgi:hypothetical protein
MAAATVVPRPFGPRLVGYLNSVPLTILVLLLLVENSLSGMEMEATVAFGYYAKVTTGPGGETARTVPRLIADTSYGYPWETFLILALWAWCGWRLICGEDKRLPDSAQTIEGGANIG